MWKYNKQDFTDDMIPEGAFGFVYGMSVVVDGKLKLYIGKKNFYSERKIPLGKKELATMTDKRASKKKLVRKLNYANYHSSNAFLKQCRKEGLEVKRTILKICNCKMELTYEEVKQLFKADVLENDNFLNDNIQGKFYRSKIKCNTNKKENDE